MKREQAPEGIIATLPVADFPEGEVGPPLDPHHPTWQTLAPWADPLASQGGYRRPSRKERVTIGETPAIEFHRADYREFDRNFITGNADWRDLRVTCCMQQLQGFGLPTLDDPLE